MQFSDDGEREDSDNDNPSSPKKSDKEFRDKLDTLDKIRRYEMQRRCAQTSPSRQARPVKKVDLGAAANYGKDQPSTVSLVNKIARADRWKTVGERKI